MNCQNISYAIKKLRNDLILYSEKIKTDIGKSDILKQKIEKQIAEIKAGYDPYQYQERDEIAKNNNFSYVSSFSEGLAWAVQDRQTVIIDYEGQIKAKINSIPLTPFKNGVAFASGIVSRPIFKTQKEEEKKLFFINSKGKKVSKYYDKYDSHDDKYLEIRKNGKWKVATMDGKTITKSFDDIFDVSEDVAIGYNRHTDVSGARKDIYKYIDLKTGREILDGFQPKSGFSMGKAVVTGSSSFWLLIDKEGNNKKNLSIECGFNDLFSYSEGMIVGTNFGGYILINPEGNVIKPKIKGYFKKGEGFKDGVCRMYRDEKVFFMNKEGEPITDEVYEEVVDFSCGRGWVKKDNFWYCIDTSGKIINRIGFKLANMFKNDIAWISVYGSYWQLIDANCNLLSDKEYSGPRPIDDGVIDYKGEYFTIYGDQIFK